MEEDSTKKSVIISLGTNLGNRLENILKTIEKIKSYGISIVKISSIYETDPVDTVENLKFFNCVIEIKTTYTPQKLLEIFLNIEKEMGRVRTHKNSPREIDIDILFYEGLILNTEKLTIPHPRLHLRKFVLKPLYEITPEFTHPILKLKISEILNKCDNSFKVQKKIEAKEFMKYLK